MIRLLLTAVVVATIYWLSPIRDARDEARDIQAALAGAGAGSAALQGVFARAALEKLAETAAGPLPPAAKPAHGHGTP